MNIVWDERKRLANRDKHGLDFSDVTEAFFENALILPGNRNRRWRGIGANAGGVICVVFARLGKEGVSIISMRAASPNERRQYADFLKR